MSDPTNPFQNRNELKDHFEVERLRAELADSQSMLGLAALKLSEFRSALEWYADYACEHSRHYEGCGKLTADECAGCRARALLQGDEK